MCSMLRVILSGIDLLRFDGNRWMFAKLKDIFDFNHFSAYRQGKDLTPPVKLPLTS